jgi:hypothetical protein
MATPFPFVASTVLTAAQLNSIGEAATSFTPTWTNYTRGNGTTIAYYTQVNKLVYIYVRETLGSTSSVTGALRMTLPIAAVRQQSVSLALCNLNDTGTTAFVGLVQSLSTTQVDFRAINAAATYALQANTSSTVPFTWTNTDFFEAGWVYESV